MEVIATDIVGLPLTVTMPIFEPAKAVGIERYPICFVVGLKVTKLASVVTGSALNLIEALLKFVRLFVSLSIFSTTIMPADTDGYVTVFVPATFPEKYAEFVNRTMLFVLVALNPNGVKAVTPVFGE